MPLCTTVGRASYLKLSRSSKIYVWNFPIALKILIIDRRLDNTAVELIAKFEKDMIISKVNLEASSHLEIVVTQSYSLVSGWGPLSTSTWPTRGLYLQPMVGKSKQTADVVSLHPGIITRM